MVAKRIKGNVGSYKLLFSSFEAQAIGEVLEAGLTSRAELDKDVLENADDNVDVLLGHVEGRAEADGLAAAQEDQEVLLVRGLLDLGGVVGSEGIESNHETLAANVLQALGVLLLKLLEALLDDTQSERERERTSGSKEEGSYNKVGTNSGSVLDELVLLNDLEEATRADHVDEVTTPGRVDTRRHLEHVVLDLIDASSRDQAANLGLLTEGDNVGDYTVVLVSPHLYPRRSISECDIKARSNNEGHLASHAHAALDLIGNEEHLELIGKLSELLPELGAEVVITTLTLDGLQDDGYTKS